MSVELTVPLSDPRQKKRYYIEMTSVRRVMTPAVEQIFRLIGFSQVEGVENLPTSGPAIVAANHLTNFDVFPLQFALPRLIFYMGKEELFRSPILDWFLRQFGGFPVYRGERDEWALNHARRVLENGQVLGIFPEGSRSKGRGLKHAKTGAARLALATGCPLVPVAINGTQNMFRRFPGRTAVRIAIGQPLYPEPGQSPQALTESLMTILAQMLPHEARGVYASR